ncbi:MAG: tyrosine-type recombinase/integrase [Acidobacteriota bacterium]|nr:tyrosine-type recombinase/integrase [Acidobacteriota bacterium]
MQSNLQLAPNTLLAYARGLEDYIYFCTRNGIGIEEATREHISLWVKELASREDTRPNRSRRQRDVLKLGQPPGLSNATIQQRLTAIRLFYDYLVDTGVRAKNPVGRGRWRGARTQVDDHNQRLLLRRRGLPWIPTEEQWDRILAAVRTESLRNRLMFALQYDCALRRQELCLLETGDFDFAHRTLRIRPETTKSQRERVVVYSEVTGRLFKAYLTHRFAITRERGRLFLSESPRNFSAPLSYSTWSKVTRDIAVRSGVENFSTHTLRHLRLTDLARSGWELHWISKFAGHKSPETTMLYIHLSGRKFSKAFERSMGAIHDWRISTLKGIT